MAKTANAYANLRAEMARRNVSIGQIAEELGVARNTVSEKLARIRPIYLEEACAIRNRFFPEFDLPYLFEETFRDTA